MYGAYNPTAIQQRVKEEGEAGKHGKVPKRCVVTGGTGFVGQRLVEMLVERGAERVVSFDIVPPSDQALQHKAIEYVVGDLTDADSVSKAIKGADCVWHVAACVGPYHPKPLYTRVNVNGTANVIAACKEHHIQKLVYSCSPTTRFFSDVRNIDGLTEAELPDIPQQKYLAEYARTKAEGELLMRQALKADPDFLAVACSPHQVYGPRDNLFLPNFMEAAGSGKLRVFGHGQNRICFTYVDNYCHSLLKAEQALYKGSKAIGKFYIVTDGDTHPYEEGYALLWDELDKACLGMGFPSIKAKLHLPRWLMMFVGFVCDFIGLLLGKVLKLNTFSVRMLTMDRWFRITAAENDLGYKPIVSYDEGWQDAIVWFRDNWLPTFDGSGGLMNGVAEQTMRKINIQGGQKVE